MQPPTQGNAALSGMAEIIKWLYCVSLQSQTLTIFEFWDNFAFKIKLYLKKKQKTKQNKGNFKVNAQNMHNFSV